MTIELKKLLLVNHLLMCQVPDKTKKKKTTTTSLSICCLEAETENFIYWLKRMMCKGQQERKTGFCRCQRFSNIFVFSVLFLGLVPQLPTQQDFNTFKGAINFLKFKYFLPKLINLFYELFKFTKLDYTLREWFCNVSKEFRLFLKRQFSEIKCVIFYHAFHKLRMFSWKRGDLE